MFVVAFERKTLGRAKISCHKQDWYLLLVFKLW